MPRPYRVLPGIASSSMPEPAVDIRDVTHRYSDHVALRNVCFAVAPGALFGLLGPNGSGKTTLFRILTALMPPTEGHVRLFGSDPVRDPAAVRRHLGVVFQEPALDGDLTIAENLRMHGTMQGLRGADLRRRIDTLLARFGITDRAGDYVKTLSGGLRRRADLARGLLHRPRLLLLDEPTTSLDPVARRTFWELLERLRREEPLTLLVTTHLMDEAARCGEVAILDRGRLVACGPPTALKADLGDETLWLETSDPAALRDRMQAQFGVEARVIGRTVQISHPDAHTLLASLYEAFGTQIDSATVRRPTLEDVFMVHAGHALDEAPHALSAEN